MRDQHRAEFPTSEVRTSDLAKSDFPVELEVPGWSSRTCPSLALVGKYTEQTIFLKIGFRPRFTTRPAAIGRYAGLRLIAFSKKALN